MSRKIVIFMVVLSIFLLAFPVLAASPRDVLIVEVGADPASAAGITEPDGEFVEIYNNTGSSIDLGGWYLSDNGTRNVTIPAGTTLDAGKILVIIADDATLGATNGYNCSGSVKHFNVGTANWFSNNLFNSNDHVQLYDNTDNLIDAVSYGTDTTAFDPPASDVFNNSGRTLQRSTYNTSFTDTDTASDWSGSSGAGSPCDVGPNFVCVASLKSHSSFSISVVGGIVLLLGVGALVLVRRKR